ncbi:MAG: histidine triad nucleotide-binding protein [Clostridia bacterium]|nr:histidine triad nucleotide-binding protein [Clostridia bacterium]
MENCLFCSIIEGKIPSTKVYEDEKTYAFRDIHPMAKTHVLVVPKCHIPSAASASEVPDDVLAACLRACQKVAQSEGIIESGYRIVSNAGPDACQSVPHLHFHVLGGQKLSESMA